MTKPRRKNTSWKKPFWHIVQTGAPTECWPWTGLTDPHGYGLCARYGERTAHRIAYVLTYGSIPEGLCLDHLCRNPSCCNPAHLEAVTNRENVLRGFSVPAKNARKTHCMRGHPLTPENVYVEPGHRHCRPCNTMRKREYRQKQRTAVAAGGAA